MPTGVCAVGRIRVKTPSDALLRQFTRIDPRHEMAFVAIYDDGDNPIQIGVSRYGAGIDDAHCECAVVVRDEWQNRDVATLLMRHLIDVARSRGIERMYSIDSTANAAMHELATHLGFTRRIDPDDATQVIHTLTLRSQSDVTSPSVAAGS
jgi:GNAT superfamily N-acetyltransferase